MGESSYKILFFIESLRSGGRERRLIELIKGLHKFSGYSMELVLTENDIHYTDIYDTGIKIHVVERKVLKKDPSVFFRFYKIVKNFKPDVIHTWGTMTTLYALPSKFLMSIPIINSEISNTKPMYLKGFRKITFKYSDLITSNTIAGLKAYNAPEHKSAVVYNGFDFDRVSNLQGRASVLKKFNITTEYVVAMIGTFYPQKDYNTFMKAANLLTKKYENITFLCIGAGDSSEIEEMSENRERILFLGKQSNIESIMNICIVGVLTTNSNMHGEGISNVLLEFCSIGVPVVATNFGGSPELIEDGVSGYLIPPFDYEKLALMIETIIADKQLAHNMGEAGKSIVRNKFSISKMVQDFMYQYKNLNKS